MTRRSRIQNANTTGGDSQRQRQGHRTRKGAVIVLFAVFIVILFAMLAFAVDFGYIFASRAALQRAVDAGVLAGTGALEQGASNAQETIVEYVQKNTVGSRSVEADEIQIELGTWNEQRRVFEPGGSSPSAVRVFAELEDHPLFFARALGCETATISAEAVAVFQPRDIMVVLDYSASMNDDSELRHISQLGRAAIEANLYQIYTELGSPTYGNMRWTPVYISSTRTWDVKRQLGLTYVRYPYPSGSWDDYIKYVVSSSNIKRAGYQKRYGYLTLVNYWLERQPMYSETPDLWKTSEQPITAVKNAVTVLLAYIQQVEANDRLGLAVYTHPNGGAKLETGLTTNMQLVEDISRERQAGHYDHYTNIGAGLQKGRLELEENARPGAFRMIVLMTDGQANRPYGRAERFLLDEAELCADDHFPVVTVSLGANADTDLMQRVADITGGIHFNIPGGQTVAEYEEQLEEVFQQIAAHRPLKLVK